MASHDDHYRTVAKVYSFALFYDAQGPFVQWLKAELESVIKYAIPSISVGITARSCCSLTAGLGSF